MIEDAWQEAKTYPISREEFISTYHKLEEQLSVTEIHEKDIEWNIMYNLSKITGKTMQDVSYCVSKWLGNSTT